ncbi:hypothetical protein LCGC14_2324570 [marine sediment metagenome]|uniref:Uncharacterized protein n=1 Tax=marine sediment metagenome TaxID=412755 RepID=A0A0F9CHE0_9ZZZZ
MSGIKVTLHRIPNDEVLPIIRVFEQANYWEFLVNSAKTTNLRIVGGGTGYNLLAEFAADAVESVEFI